MPARTHPAETDPRLTASRAWLLWAVMVLVLLWPVAWNEGVLAFPDSRNYYQQGGRALEFGMSLIFGAEARVPEAGGGIGAGDGIPDIRSVPFALSVNRLVWLLGPIAPAVALSALTAWLIVLTVRPLPPARAALAALAAAGLTTLPFHASVIMPDVMAGWLVLIVALLAMRAGRGDAPGRATTAALLVVMFVAIASHLSHIPLAMALLPGLGLVLLARRRWGLAAAVQLPLVATLALNVGVGQVVTGGVSIAPARLPLLVARTFTDGPGREYLAETCPGSGWTLCEVYGGTVDADDVPATVSEALWREDSIEARSTPAQRRAIAREEVDFVLAVLRAHPVEQGAALARNALRQLWLIGIDDVYVSHFEALSPTQARQSAKRVRRDAPVRLIEPVQWAAVAAGLLGLVLAAWRGGPGARPAAALLVLGLAVNAAVCGGLSAPADRYQGRLIWTLVLVGLALALRPQARPEERVTDSRGRLVRPRSRVVTRG